MTVPREKASHPVGGLRAAEALRGPQTANATIMELKRALNAP